MTHFATGLFRAAIAAVFVLASAAAAITETRVGSNIDSRVVLALKVTDAGAAAMLPDDWGLLTLPKGPLAGANLLLVFIDRHLALDPEGKPLLPHDGRSLAIVVYGVNPEVKGARLFVTRVYETPPVADSYGNGAAAAISREMALSGPVDGTRTHRETWTVAPETGGEIALELTYAAGRPGWSRNEALPYSAADPAFHRIYRYDQLADLAMSVALARALDGSVSLSSTVPELAGIFDGQETLLGVLAVPVYVREVFLP